jgi:hypothetical protein
MEAMFGVDTFLSYGVLSVNLIVYEPCSYDELVRLRSTPFDFSFVGASSVHISHSFVGILHLNLLHAMTSCSRFKLSLSSSCKTPPIFFHPRSLGTRLSASSAETKAE